MPDDFEDDLRRANNEPTLAQDAKAHENRKRAQEEWQKGEPKRQEYRDDLNRRVLPIIDAIHKITDDFQRARKSAVTRKEQQTDNINVLWQTEFRIAPTVERRNVRQAAALANQENSWWMEIILTADGFIEVNYYNSYNRLKPVTSSLIRISDFGEPKIKSIFKILVTYFSQRHK